MIALFKRSVNTLLPHIVNKSKSLFFVAHLIYVCGVFNFVALYLKRNSYQKHRDSVMNILPMQMSLITRPSFTQILLIINYSLIQHNREQHAQELIEFGFMNIRIITLKNVRLISSSMSHIPTICLNQN